MRIGINLIKGSIQTDQTPELIVGIDLGTTNSLVAYIHPKYGDPRIVHDAQGNNRLVPSVLSFDQQGTPIVGNEAKQRLLTHPSRTVYSVKRLMGKSYADVQAYAPRFSYQIIDTETDELVKIRIDDRFYTPIELSARILSALKQRAEAALNQPIQKAVVTVPAYFNDAQRQATRDAGKLAGLEVLRIVNEPTAASLAYGIGIDPNQVQTVAVYDLGGGTFDVSILRIDKGVFEVLATHGDTFLGGDDIDQCIVDYWTQQQNDLLPPPATTTTNEQHKAAQQQLRLYAEAAKIHLSDHDHFSTSSADALSLHLDRATLQTLLQPLIQRTLVCCQQALHDAQLSTADIDQIVMVGGSTRTPAVKQAVAQFFGKPINDHLNPDEVVALGAAIQADILAGNKKDTLLLDVTPLSLGVATAGGLMDVLVPRNTRIPTRAARQYTTQVDGQSSMSIAVYQGERDLVKHNRKLGEFELRQIPAMPAGLPKVEIAFVINADGMVQVRAKELRSGVEQSIVVTPQYGLSNEDMSRMLLESIQHAAEDMQTRALQEAINEAQHLLTATHRFLDKQAAWLTPDEISQTQQLAQQLTNSLTQDQKDLIHQHIQTLNEFTRPFAERVMDLAVREAMKGKKI